MLLVLILLLFVGTIYAQATAQAQSAISDGFIQVCAGITVLLVGAGVIASIKMANTQARFGAQFEAWQKWLAEMRVNADSIHARMEQDFHAEDTRIKEQLIAITTSIKSDVAVLSSVIERHQISPHWRQEDYEFFKKSTVYQNQTIKDLHSKAAARDIQIGALTAAVKRFDPDKTKS